MRLGMLVTVKRARRDGCGQPTSTVDPTWERRREAPKDGGQGSDGGGGQRRALSLGRPGRRKGRGHRVRPVGRRKPRAAAHFGQHPASEQEDGVREGRDSWEGEAAGGPAEVATSLGFGRLSGAAGGGEGSAAFK